MIGAISKVGAWRTLTGGVRNRFVVHPDDPHRHSPFILAVEDWIEPRSTAFGMHPHRGFETVTLVLEGAERYRDHLGTEGLARAGDVQWTRAARGIFHAGAPEGDERLHALQLWLNLPRSLKSADPATFGQCLADTLVDEHDGVHVIVHAGHYGGRVQPHLSLWPISLIQVTFEPKRSVVLDIDPRWTTFVYVLVGQVSIGGGIVSEGEVAWLTPDNGPPGQDHLRIEALADAQIVCYSAPPIDEPVVMGGPFVMTTQAEIRQAYADLANGELA